MVRKATPLANPDNLVKALQNAFSEPVIDEDRPGRILAAPITHFQISKVMRLARPIYDLVNGQDRIPYRRPSMAEDEDFVIALNRAGMKVRSLQFVPRYRPDLFDVPKSILSDETWERLLIESNHNELAIGKLFSRLGTDSALTTPKDLSRRMRKRPGRQAPFGPASAFEVCGYDLENVFDLVRSYADYITEPSRMVAAAKKARVIEQLLPHLVRWPMLGTTPDGRSLCILVG